jgi:hypothetical protein
MPKQKSSKQNTGSSKVREFPIVSEYKLGYRNREDVTNLPAGVLIVGSQNVITNVSERVQIRQGYALDGATSAVAAGILASFDWLTRNNGEKHLRAGGLTSAANDGVLQYRYVDSTGAVTWRDLLTGLTTVSYNFCTYWNTTESLRECLFVNGTSNIYQWNGAVTTLASATVNTVTKQGTDTWADTGFYANGTRTIIIGGVSATYSGGETTTTLTGVSVDFSNTGTYPVGSVIHQAVRTTANSAMTTITSTFKNGLIANLNNQIFVGSLTSSVLWISKVNSFTDYSGSTPRQTGEGASLILDANVVALLPQENYMYVSCGYDHWYNVSFELQTSTVGVTYEQVKALKLKTGKRQGARSQAFASHMKNDIIVTTFETTIDTFGRIETSLATPQTTNISDPIKLDIDNYNFTDGSIFYFQYNIYVALPNQGIILIYSLVNASWQPPQTLPISRFYIVDGELYGHSYNTTESYKLFTGYADRVYSGFTGYPILANWVFSYQNYGTRTYLKSADYLYIEGYINTNTTSTATITYELGSNAVVKTFTIDGSDQDIVAIPTSLSSIGKQSLGKQKLGGTGTNSIQNLPAKFRVEKSFTNTDFFECSIAFEVNGIDNRLELLAFGLNARPSSQEAISIRQ